MPILSKHLEYMSKPINPPYVSDIDVLKDVESYNCMFIDYPVRKGDEYVEFYKEDEFSEKFSALKLHLDTYINIIENKNYEIRVVETRNIWMYIMFKGMWFNKVLDRY